MVPAKKRKKESLKKVKQFPPNLPTSQIKAQNIQQGKILCLPSIPKLTAMIRTRKTQPLMRKKKKQNSIDKHTLKNNRDAI